MADSKVTDLTAASLPLAGTEVVYLVQGGNDTQATAQDIANLNSAAIAAKAPTASPTFTGTVTLPAGQVVNGVTLTAAGSATDFLNADGNYVAAGGGSSQWTTTGSDIYYDTGGVKIGAASAPDSKSILDLQSTTKGFLPPRMTAAQMNAIASPPTGLMVFLTDVTGPYFYQAGWKSLYVPFTASSFFQEAYLDFAEQGTNGSNRVRLSAPAALAADATITLNANTGTMLVGNGKQVYDATNTAGGTTGAQTINKPSGTVNFAAAATTLVVTNSLCTTSSLVFCEVRTNDATATIKNVVPAAGSFTITLNAAATAETSVGFFVIN